jgi:hypothetical protein
MTRVEAGRCGRCGGDPFLAGTPYIIWVWFSLETGTEARALHMCQPCGREFPSTLERGEYLKAVAFG